MTDAELKAFAVVMQEMHVLRFSGEEEGESFRIEMDPSAFAPRLAASLAPPGNWNCAKCGTEWTASWDRICAACGTKNWPPPTAQSAPLPPEREPTTEEIAFASSIPVTDAERNGREP